MESIYFYKVRKDAKIPQRAHTQVVVVTIATPDMWETPHDPAIRNTATGSEGFGSTGEF